MTTQTTGTAIPLGSMSAPLSVPDAIEARRSIRKYQPGPIPQADLDRILELAGLAPSTSNIQPWRFVVVRDPAMKTKLRAVAYNQAQVEAAPAVIVAYTDMADVLASLHEVVHPGVPADAREATLQRLNGFIGKQTDEQSQALGLGQTFIAVGYLSLAAQSLGYATSIMGGFDGEGVKALFELPANAAIAALICVGVADEEGFTHHRHAKPRIVREV